MTHICVSKLTIIGSDNGLSPDRRQAINWTNAGLLLIGHTGTNFNEILIEILTFSFKKRRLKVSSAKRRPFCLGLNVLMVTNMADKYSHIEKVLWLHSLQTCHRELVDYGDLIMIKMASQITSLAIVYSTVHSGEDQRKHQSSASLAFVQGIHRDRWISRKNGQ